MSRKEFFKSGKGDCEDYAIAKFTTLKELGIKNLLFVVGEINNNGKKEHHMILTYAENQDVKSNTSETYVLDNNNSQVILKEDLSNFNALYSFDKYHLYQNRNGNIGALHKKEINNLSKFKRQNN